VSDYVFLSIIDLTLWIKTDGLKVKKFIINNNGYIEDQAISMLSYLKDTLTHLEIISCIGVTDQGVKSLVELQ